MKANKVSTARLSLELKYCERCGGLWLRPAGGEQIYCAVCGRAIAELPPASHEVRNARAPRMPRWGRNGAQHEEDCEVELGKDAAGGVA
jgi:Zn-finger nucleic acid-binding protein